MRRFDSIGKFVEAAVSGRNSHESSSKPGAWSGTATFEDAANFARFGGWEPKVDKRFKNFFANLEPHLRKFTEIGFERGMDVSGDEVHMQRYLDGEPEHMMEWLPVEHQVTKRALCLVVGHSIVSYIDADELYAKGQALIALVQSLSLLGYELEIYSEQTVGPLGGYGRTPRRGSSSERYSVVTRLHAAGEPLDMTAIEFAIGNPSWLRRLIFGLEEGENETIRDTFGFGRGGYGKPDGIHHQELLNADVAVNLGDPWFHSGDPKDAYRWVLQELKQLGVLAEDVEVEIEAA
jgi:hypothetical protein